MCKSNTSDDSKEGMEGASLGLDGGFKNSPTTTNHAVDAKSSPDDTPESKIEENKKLKMKGEAAD